MLLIFKNDLVLSDMSTNNKHILFTKRFLKFYLRSSSYEEVANTAALYIRQNV